MHQTAVFKSTSTNRHRFPSRDLRSSRVSWADRLEPWNRHPFVWLVATLSSTSTTTLRTTSAVSGPLETLYTACDTNNTVSTINGNVISNAQPSNGFSIAPSVANAYDCCFACMQSDKCGAALFYDTFLGDSQGQCYMVGNGGVCAGSRSVAKLFMDSGSGAASIASNGICGQYSYP